MADIWGGIGIGVCITIVFSGAINSIYIVFFKDEFEAILRRIKARLQQHGKKIGTEFIKNLKRPINYTEINNHKQNQFWR